MKIKIKTTARYTAKRKAAIIAKVANGEITLEEVCERHNITSEEFEGWCKSLDRSGQQGLRITRLQHYRTA
jgi:transposase-like protein